MNAADLLTTLVARGVELQAHGDKLRFRPLERLSPIDLKNLREHKATILRLLRSEGIILDAWYPDSADRAEFEITPMFPDESDAANEFYWVNLSDTDRDYLTGPRKFPAPCPWCGGACHHNRLCDELRTSWEPTLPFGKHKGKPLSAIPREYLEWLASCSAGISDELCDSIKLQLQGGNSEATF